jgi:peptidoglycan/xylan/chitin deacetylase (PgdA/CDA1 family)
MILKFIRKLLFDYRFFLKKDKVYVLMFHKVNDEYGPFYKGMPKVTFYKLIDYVSSHFEIIHFHDLETYSENNKKPLLIITFDDGMDDIRTNVFNYLMYRKIKFTINIDTKILIDSFPQYFIQVYDLLNQSDAIEGYYDPKYMKEVIKINYDQPYLTEAAFTSLLSPMNNDEKENFIDRMRKKLGVNESFSTKVLSKEWILQQKDNPQIVFGSHSHSHPVFTQIDIYEREQEIQLSKEILTLILGKEISIFAYPNGECDTFTDDLLFKMGFHYILKTNDALNLKSSITKKSFYRINMYHSNLELGILQSIGILPKIRWLKSILWS